MLIIDTNLLASGKYRLYDSLRIYRIYSAILYITGSVHNLRVDNKTYLIMPTIMDGVWVCIVLTDGVATSKRVTYETKLSYNWTLLKRKMNNIIAANDVEIPLTRLNCGLTQPQLLSHICDISADMPLTTNIGKIFIFNSILVTTVVQLVDQI